jgi:hypothetical protein
MHCVFHRVAGYEHVAMEIWYRRVWHHEPVSIVMQHQPSRDFVSAHATTWLRRASWLFAGPRGASVALGLAAGQFVASPGQFLDGSPFFQPGQRFKQESAFRSSQVQRAGDFVRGCRFATTL